MGPDTTLLTAEIFKNYPAKCEYSVSGSEIFVCAALIYLWDHWMFLNMWGSKQFIFAYLYAKEIYFKAA